MVVQLKSKYQYISGFFRKNWLDVNRQQLRPNDLEMLYLVYVIYIRLHSSILEWFKSSFNLFCTEEWETKNRMTSILKDTAERCPLQALRLHYDFLTISYLQSMYHFSMNWLKVTGDNESV